MNAPLQNSLQSAVGKVSKAQRVAGAVCGVIKTGDPAQYEHPSDLYSYAVVRGLVRDANDLSVTLSDAYKQGLVGRIHVPRGREKFAYGPPGPRAEGVKIQRGQRNVIKSVEKRVVGYRVVKVFKDAADAVYALSRHPGAVVEIHNNANGEYHVRFPVWTADQLVLFLCSGRDDLAVEEVTE